MIVCNQDGEVLLAKGVQFDVIEDPMIVELLVLREALFRCLANGFTMMRFEGDAKVIIDKINHRDTQDSRIGALLEEVLYSFSIHSGFRVRFVGRSNNRVAYLVVRKALSLHPSSCHSFDFRASLNFMM
ncbi:unnamed protein product [Linum trigynum]|uniref:RNase H type-1 domain-containing protein n=1 Tax=Linum trigynum TaxID=586398 RepID=A0AAV2EML1_9ROSI